MWYAGYDNLIAYSLYYDGRKVKNLKELDDRIAALTRDIDDDMQTIHAIDEGLARDETLRLLRMGKVIVDAKNRLLARRESMQSERLMVQQARDEWILMQKALEAEKAFLTANKA